MNFIVMNITIRACIRGNYFFRRIPESDESELIALSKNIHVMYYSVVHIFVIFAYIL